MRMTTRNREKRRYELAGRIQGEKDYMEILEPQDHADRTQIEGVVRYR